MAMLTEEQARALAAHWLHAWNSHDLMWGLSSVVLYYTNQKGTRTGEFMELDAQAKVLRVVANYSG